MLRPDGAEGYNLGRGLGHWIARKGTKVFRICNQNRQTKPEIFLNLATNLRAVGKVPYNF